MANEKRLVDANVLIRDLTAMKSVYDAIALDGMIKALNEAPAVDAVEVVHGRWIPVTERLPEEDGSYLVCSERGAVYANHFYTKKHFTSVYMGGYVREAKWSRRGTAKVTHWMPLPEPPKGE